jgi:HEAT repeat protein
MRFLSVFSLFVLLPALAVGDSNIDLQLKKKIIENCPLAVTEIHAKSPPEIAQTMEFLGRILELPPNEMLPSYPDVMLPSIPGSAPIQAAEEWLIPQPIRTLKTKRCALEILGTLAPISVNYLPQVLSLYERDRTLSIELEDFIINTVLNIASAARKAPEQEIANELIQKLIGFYHNPRTKFLAEDIIFELADRSIPALVRELQKPDLKLRETTLILLKELNPKGNLLALQLLQLLESSDDDLRKRIVEYLIEFPQIRVSSLLPISERLNDHSTAVQNAAVLTLKKLLNYEIISDLQPICLKIGEKIFTLLEQNQSSELIELLALISHQLPHYEESVIAFISKDLSIRASYLPQLLEHSTIHSPEMLRLLKKAISLQTGSKQLETILLISKLSPSDSTQNREPLWNEVLLFLSDLLKEVSRRGETERREQIILATGHILYELQAGVRAKRFFPYYFEALSFNKIPPILAQRNALENIYTLLLSIPKESAAGIYKAAKSNNPLVRERAAILLARLPKTDKNAQKLLLSLLKDQAVSVRNTEVSPPQNQPSLQELISNLEGSDNSKKLLTLELLRNLNKSAKEAVPSLLELINQKQDPHLAHEAIVTLSYIDPEAFKISKLLLGELEGDNFTWALNTIPKLEPTIALTVLREEFEEKDDDGVAHALFLIGGFGERAKEFVPLLIPYLTSKNSLFKFRSTLALLQIAPTTVGVEESLRREILGQYREELYQTKLPQTAKPIIEKISANAKYEATKYFSNKLLENNFQK